MSQNILVHSSKLYIGIPNYDNSNDVMILNFVILLAKYYIYNCKKKWYTNWLFQFSGEIKISSDNWRIQTYNV